LDAAIQIRTGRGDAGLRVAGLAWVVALAALGIALSGPPPVVPATAPAANFSAERAMGHVRETARAPHPAGSAEHDRVRDYIVQQLTALGLTPSIQKTMALSARFRVAATVENILARKPGQTPRPALLLAAHYDSVPTGPGAGDDGAGVAALLETARALAAGPPLRDDVILLFSDGEELGLLGAEAFAKEHPWRTDVGAVLNFDNRGTSGAVVMYQTSPQNGWMVRQLADVAPSPRASSLSAAVAERMPNSTDFAVLREAGMPGLNFGFIGSPQNYHTPQDTPQNLDMRSLQQTGSYALALARRLANADLTRVREPDLVFFNAVGNRMVTYPVAWARPLGYGALGLFMVAAVLGLARRAVRPGGLLLSLVWLVVSLLAAWRVGDLLATSLPRLYDGVLPAGPWFFSPVYAVALCLVVAALVVACWEILPGGARWEELALLGAGAWTALAVRSALNFPAASFLGVWPLVPVLVALAAMFATGPGRTGWKVVLAGAAATPGVLLLAPLFPALHLALGMSTLGASVRAVLEALLLWLSAALLAPAWGESGARGVRLSLPLLAAGGAVLAWGLVGVRYNDRHPRPETMIYSLDADRGRAQWLSPKESQSSVQPARMDAWRRQFLSATPGIYSLTVGVPWTWSLMCWSHEAPRAELPAPAAELLSETREEGRRVFRLRLVPPPGTSRLWFEVRGRKILAVEMGGSVIGDAHTPRWKIAPAAVATSGSVLQQETWNVLYAAPPKEGLEVVLAVPAQSAMEVQLAAITDRLPEIPGHTYTPRPASVTMQHLSDATLVSKTFTFECQ
jgi:hypothetical protein